MEKLSTKSPTEDGSEGLRSSLGVSQERGAETKKAQEIQGFDAICLLLTSLGETLRIGEEGLEPPTSTV